ncbi:MAG: hypothetical protein KGZ63_11940 [Clostridiales bacterium]|jgi:hypothetical protein|nr:hypothetical protein [Clostridiales bacterium]
MRLSNIILASILLLIAGCTAKKINQPSVELIEKTQKNDSVSIIHNNTEEENKDIFYTIFKEKIGNFTDFKQITIQSLSSDLLLIDAILADFPIYETLGPDYGQWFLVDMNTQEVTPLIINPAHLMKVKGFDGNVITFYILGEADVMYGSFPFLLNYNIKNKEYIEAPYYCQFSEQYILGVADHEPCRFGSGFFLPVLTESWHNDW